MQNALLKLDYRTATKDDIDKLIERGANVNAHVPTKGSNGIVEKERTPIFFAIEAGNYEAFQQLVLRGANLTVYSAGCFPSEFAMSRLHSRFRRGEYLEISDWFKKNKKFIEDIQKDRIPNFLDWNSDDKPLVMEPASACLKAKKLSETQNYVGKYGTYHFGDYEGKKNGVEKETSKGPATLLRSLNKKPTQKGKNR